MTQMEVQENGSTIVYDREIKGDDMHVVYSQLFNIYALILTKCFLKTVMSSPTENHLWQPRRQSRLQKTVSGNIGTVRMSTLYYKNSISYWRLNKLLWHNLNLLFYSMYSLKFCGTSSASQGIDNVSVFIC